MLYYTARATKYKRPFAIMSGTYPGTNAILDFARYAGKSAGKSDVEFLLSALHRKPSEDGEVNKSQLAREYFHSLQKRPDVLQMLMEHAQAAQTDEDGEEEDVKGGKEEEEQDVTIMTSTPYDEPQLDASEERNEEEEEEEEEQEEERRDGETQLQRIRRLLTEKMTQAHDELEQESQGDVKIDAYGLFIVQTVENPTGVHTFHY